MWLLSYHQNLEGKKTESKYLATNDEWYSFEEINNHPALKFQVFTSDQEMKNTAEKWMETFEGPNWRHSPKALTHDIPPVQI